MVAHAQSLHSGSNASRHIPNSASSTGRLQLQVSRLSGGRPAGPVPNVSRPDTVILAALGADAEGAGPQSRPAEGGSSWNPAASSRASEGEPQLVRVRLCVNYRVHSRQMLCIGGSQIPFGWSFLSIAKVPMVWTEGDLWTAEVGCFHSLPWHRCFQCEHTCWVVLTQVSAQQVLLPANTKIEYKYVILEEQVPHHRSAHPLRRHHVVCCGSWALHAPLACPPLTHTVIRRAHQQGSC